MAHTPINPYKELSCVKKSRTRISSHATFTPPFVMSQLTQASDPANTYENRVKGRQIFLENPVRQSKLRKQLEEKQQQRQTQEQELGITSKRREKEHGFWRFDESQIKYHNILPLHHLWMDYMSELLGLRRPISAASDTIMQHMPSNSSMQAKLVKADFHGSIITVHQTKNTSTLGLSGIVILDTENTFTIVTRRDKVKTVPKQNTVFIFSVPLYQTSSLLQQCRPTTLQQPNQERMSWKPELLTVLDMHHIEFELYGNQFCFHSADRASRKFKHKETIELF